MKNSKNSSAPAVLIVGAGPVGITLALQLQRQGIRYRIIEKNAGPSVATKAMAVHSRTLEIFRDFGIAEAAIDAGFKIRRFRIQSEGTTILKYDFELLNSAYPFLLSLPQPKAEALLLQRLQELGGMVEWNTELAELTQTADAVHTVLVHADGRRENLETRWVAGCDGARSAVRRNLGLAYDGDSYHRFFMLADVDIEWDGAPDEGVFFLGSQEGYVAVAPLTGKGRYRLFVEMPYDLPPEDQRPKLDLATFQGLCDGRGQKMQLSNEAWTTAAAFQHRRVDRQQVGRVFLAGDAAHIGSPIGGQYMNMGVSEAYNLAWKLAYVEQGIANPKLLESYSAERHPVTIEAERTAHILTKILTLRNRWLIKLRDTVFPVVTGLATMQAKLPWMISGHRYHYHGSPVVTDARGKTKPRQRKGSKIAPGMLRITAGDLAPDLALWQKPGTQPQRLLDLFHNGFTLLMLVAGDDSSARLDQWALLGKEIQDAYPSIRAHLVFDALQAPEKLGTVATILDPDQRLHDRYSAADGLLVLIRPDGYIAFVGNDGTQLEQYLNTRSMLIRAVKPKATRRKKAVVAEVSA